MYRTDRQSTAEARQDDHWFKSSFSSGSCTCVEVRFDPTGNVLIRDSKYLLDPAHQSAKQPTIAISADGWQRVIEKILAAQPLITEGTVLIRLLSDGSATFTCSRAGVTLAYNHDEVAAFTRGLRDGEFAPLRAA
jgi:hypothetical protein